MSPHTIYGRDLHIARKSRLDRSQYSKFPVRWVLTSLGFYFKNNKLHEGECNEIDLVGFNTDTIKFSVKVM